VGREDTSRHIRHRHPDHGDHRDHHDRLPPTGAWSGLPWSGSVHIGQGSSADHHNTGPPTELPWARLPGPGVEEGDLARHTGRLRRGGLDNKS